MWFHVVFYIHPHDAISVSSLFLEPTKETPILPTTKYPDSKWSNKNIGQQPWIALACARTVLKWTSASSCRLKNIFHLHRMLLLVYGEQLIECTLLRVQNRFQRKRIYIITSTWNPNIKHPVERHNKTNIKWIWTKYRNTLNKIKL